jgi:hypothetical protein
MSAEGLGRPLRCWRCPGGEQHSRGRLYLALLLVATQRLLFLVCTCCCASLAERQLAIGACAAAMHACFGSCSVAHASPTDCDHLRAQAADARQGGRDQHSEATVWQARPHASCTPDRVKLCACDRQLWGWRVHHMLRQHAAHAWQLCACAGEVQRAGWATDRARCRASLRPSWQPSCARLPASGSSGVIDYGSVPLSWMAAVSPCASPATAAVCM